MKKIVIIGCGGLAKEIKYLIDAINKEKFEWNLLGFIDDWSITRKGDNLIDGYEVLGDINYLNKLDEEIFGIIAIGNPHYIKKTRESINNANILFPNLIHPTADSDSMHLTGEGNIIGFCSKISCNVEIGDFNFFNSMCVVGHDTVIGSFNVFNPRVQISGSIKIGNGNFFGMGSSVIEKKKVGNYNKICASSLVIKNVKDHESLFGIPATKVDF